MTIDLAQLVTRLESLDEQELDALPDGMIQLDRSGRILRYNATEAQLARREQRAQIGRNFFDEVAPCTKVRDFYGRFVEGLARRQLHEKFAFRFTFPFGVIDVAVTLFYSQATDSVWVQVSRDAGAVATASIGRSKK